jgi:hypothetical protein
MRGLFFIIALSSAVGCASEDSSEALARECGRLREHMIDLRLEGTHVDVAAHRKAISNALGEGFVDQCAAQLTRVQVHCALAASDSNAAMDCTREATRSDN